ncbi:hypothetical protein Tco_0130718 [Tanacetum coccineum]
MIYYLVVLDLEKTKTDQAIEISSLKKRVKKLEMKRKSRHIGLTRLRKDGAARRVKSSKDKDNLGDQEDPSKQGRNIADIDQDVNVTLVDEAQEKLNDEDMFEVNNHHGEEVIVEDTVALIFGEDTAAPTILITTAEVVTTISDVTTTIDELTLVLTLIEIRAAKPKTIKAITTVATLVTTASVSRLMAKGIAIMIEPERPLKRKDQIVADEELAR